MDQLIADLAKNWPIIFSACIVTGTGVWLILTIRNVTATVSDLREDFSKHTNQDMDQFTKLSEQVEKVREESNHQHKELSDKMEKEFQHLDEKGSARVKTVHERLDRIKEKQ